MNGISIATVAINQTPFDWKGNMERIQNALTEIADNDEINGRNTDIVLFPELTITGYGCEDLFHSSDLLRRAFEKILILTEFSSSLLPNTAILVGLPLRKGDCIYNCMGIIHGGRIHGFIPKSNLAGDGVHYEPRWFTPYTELNPDDEIKIGDEIYPFGQMLVEKNGIRFCVEICEDAWVANRPALLFLNAGLDIILNPSASHFSFSKYQVREGIAIESSRAFVSLFVMTNLLGCESGRMIYDGSSIFASYGKILKNGHRFSFKDHTVTRYIHDPDVNRGLRSRLYSYREQKIISYRENHKERILMLDSEYPVFTKTVPISVKTAGAGFETKTAEQLLCKKDKEHEFIYALTLGLFDYLRKSGVKGAVVSLSGGTDSAVCAILLQRMFVYCFQEIGPEAALHKLGLEKIWEELQESINTKDSKAILSFVCKKFIHTIYQETKQNTAATKQASSELAKALNSDHSEVNIQSLIDDYTEMASLAIGRKPDWATDDLSLQNIQARVRSPFAWFLANLTNSILITTSNRSEAAVGYCTMDGDTSGGLAPIAGVDKAFLQHWIQFMKNIGDGLGGPISELQYITNLPPTAELRPHQTNQTDESDIMPYKLLDQIERLSIRDRKSPAEILTILLDDQNCSYNAAELRIYIKRFFSLWSKNQWKRERYAPSFHLDDENLDPKTWYRFPILSGSFQEELEGI